MDTSVAADVRRGQNIAAVRPSLGSEAAGWPPVTDTGAHLNAAALLRNGAARERETNRGADRTATTSNCLSVETQFQVQIKYNWHKYISDSSQLHRRKRKSFSTTSESVSPPGAAEVAVGYLQSQTLVISCNIISSRTFSMWQTLTRSDNRATKTHFRVSAAFLRGSKRPVRKHMAGRARGGVCAGRGAFTSRCAAPLHTQPSAPHSAQHNTTQHSETLLYLRLKVSWRAWTTNPGCPSPPEAGGGICRRSPFWVKRGGSQFRCNNNNKKMEKAWRKKTPNSDRKRSSPVMQLRSAAYPPCGRRFACGYRAFLRRAAPLLCVAVVSPQSAGCVSSAAAAGWKWENKSGERR